MSARHTAIVVCDQWLGSNGYAGMKALRRRGWSVHVAAEWEYVPVRWRSVPARVAGRAVRRTGISEFNRELLLQANRLRPAMLLVFKGTFVRAETVRRLREMGVHAYCFYPDNSFFAHGPRLPRALPEYDWVFCAKSFGPPDMRAQLGIVRASCLLHGFDRDLHRPLDLDAEEGARFQSDVSFIGTWSPKKEHVLTNVAQRLPRIRMRIWGEQWNRSKLNDVLRPSIMGHEVIGDDYARAICGSLINLAILSERRIRSSSDDQVTSRTFHIPACGGFMLHERTDELLAHFEENTHVAAYHGLDELASRIDEFLRDTERRQVIADAGRQLVWGRDSWDDRIAEIVARHEELSR